MDMDKPENGSEDSLAYPSHAGQWLHATSNAQNPLHDFFNCVEEANRKILDFNADVQVYEATTLEASNLRESQIRYENLQVKMSNISMDIRCLRNSAWQLGAKFNGQLLLWETNVVLAAFQSTCALLHSVEARSRHAKESTARALSDWHFMELYPIQEVQEPSHQLSELHGRSSPTTCMEDASGGRRSGIEIDYGDLNLPTQLIYEGNVDNMEASSRQSPPLSNLGFGEPVNKARIWRKRKLHYISVAAACIILVMIVGLTVGYTAAKTPRQRGGLSPRQLSYRNLSYTRLRQS